MTGVNAVPPMPPRLEIVNVPPCISSDFSAPSRARAPSLAISCARSYTPLRSASRNTGTIRPFGVSTAMPMWMYFLTIRLSPPGPSDALKIGCSASAEATAFVMKASRVMRTPRAAASSLIDRRNASSSVMSASSWLVTWGTFSQARCRCEPERCLMRDSGRVSTSPNFVKSTAGIGGIPVPSATAGGAESAPFTNPLTSSRSTRPLRPVPLTLARSTPSSRA